MTNDRALLEFQKILNWKIFEDLFCPQFYKKIMIDALYLETEFENISGVCDYLLGNKISQKHTETPPWNIIKIVRI